MRSLTKGLRGAREDDLAFRLPEFHSFHAAPCAIWLVLQSFPRTLGCKRAGVSRVDCRFPYDARGKNLGSVVLWSQFEPVFLGSLAER